MRAPIEDVTPVIKIRRDDSDVQIDERVSAAVVQEDIEKHKMYTQTRFFDPDMLSFKPMVYPNIEIAKHVQSNTSFGPPMGIKSNQQLNQSIQHLHEQS